MNTFISNEEYITQGKENTSKALKELQKQLEAKEKTMKRALNTEKEFDDNDSESDDHAQMNFTLIENEISNEINSFKSSNPSQYSRAVDSNSNDRILKIFNNLMVRNNKLLNLNNKLSSNIKQFKREITVLETNSHTDKVFNNSITIENNELSDRNKALTISIKENYKKIKNLNRAYYICRFLIGILVIFSIFLFVKLIFA